MTPTIWRCAHPSRSKALRFVSFGSGPSFTKGSAFSTTPLSKGAKKLMAKRATAAAFSSILLDEASPEPLYRQVYSRLRTAILMRQLPPGTRLPSTRELANELNISRNTVMNAYDQLLAEGYLE